MGIPNLHFAWEWAFFSLLPVVVAGWCFFAKTDSHELNEPSLRLNNTEGLIQKIHGKDAISPLVMAGLLLVLVALSRPQIPDNVISPTPSFILALDVSGSMEQPYVADGKSQSKVDWIKSAVRRFTAELSKRHLRSFPEIGVVLFADHAYRMFPQTHDLDQITATINTLKAGMIGEKTSLDEAITISLEDTKNKDNQAPILVILTDGLQTSGSIRLKQSFVSAVKRHIAVFPILLDSNVTDTKQGLFPQLVRETGGKILRFEGEQTLLALWDEVFKKTSINGADRTWREVYQWPLGLALLIFLCQGLLSYRERGVH